MVPSEPLTTAGAVREALGSSYSTVCRLYDDLKRERAKTAILGRRLFPGARACAICGGSGLGFRIELAHIQALEECGTTVPENVILLCRRLRALHHERGCHQLFDNGFASMSEISALRFDRPSDWQPELRLRMQERHQQHFGSRSSSAMNEFEILMASIDAEKTRGALLKAQVTAIRASIRYAATSDEHFVFRLKAIEMMRRRAARSSLDEAARHFDALLRFCVPYSRRASFFYEGGYIELLRGNHEKARAYFIASRDAVDTTEEGWKWAAAAIMAVQCEVVLCGMKAPWNVLLAAINKAERLAKVSAGRNGARWVMNCRLGRARLLLAKGDITEAVQAKEAALHSWKSMTTITGWDSAFRAFILSVSGIIAARKGCSESDARAALRYLVRALVVLLGAARMHPETVRDVLFATADALAILRKTDLAGRFRDVAKRTQDGSSWLQPYRRYEPQR